MTDHDEEERGGEVLKEIVEAVWISAVMSAIFWTSGIILYVIAKAAGAF